MVLNILRIENQDLPWGVEVFLRLANLFHDMQKDPHKEIRPHLCHMVDVRFLALHQQLEL